jgi:flagellar hook-associated protein 3 FlgL
MRITFNRLNANLSAINTAAGQMARAKQQVETGRRISVPSDDPAGTRRSIEARAELGRLDAYDRTADSVNARLTLMDTVLNDVVDQLTEGLTTATSARGSAVNQSTRDAAAAKLEGIRNALVSDLNTTFRGTYLFSGSEATTPAYAQVAGVWTYGGDTTAVMAETAPGRTSAITRDGSALAQGTDAANLFTEMDLLITAVQTGDDAGMAAGIQALERAFARATGTQTRVGLDMQTLGEGQLQVQADRIATKANLSKDEDANMAQAITDMTQADTAYRAALQAASLQKISLLDFLR